MITIEASKTLVSSKPQIAFVVLLHIINLCRRQTVFSGKSAVNGFLSSCLQSQEEKQGKNDLSVHRLSTGTTNLADYDRTCKQKD